MAAAASLVWLPRTFWYRERSLSRMSEPELRSWTERRPDDPLGHSFLGLARGRSGDTAEAARQWTRALELDPTLAGVRWRLARLLAAAGQESEAERLLRQGLQLDPAAVRLHAELGRLYEESASFRSAAAAWEKAASLAPHDAETWHHLGRCWMSLNEEARALRAYRRAAELAPRSATYQKALAGALRLERQYAEAERYCRRAIALDAADPEAQFALARLLWDRDGATAQTEAQMRRALALQPDNPILHYSMAAVCRERRQLAESAREYQATLRLLEAREPPPTEAGWAMREEWLSQMEGPHLNLAGVLERLGRAAEAARHRAAFRRISDYRNHVHQLQVRIDNRPDDAGLRFELARAHARAGFHRAPQGGRGRERGSRVHEVPAPFSTKGR